jgi:WD40 repeat protein
LANHEIALLSHPGNPQSVAFSKSGNLLVTADEESIRIWQMPGTKEKLALPGHAGVPALAFSPNGSVLASASHDGRVILWNAINGEKIQDHPGFRGLVATIAFSPDGRMLACGDFDGAIRIWEVSSWEELARFDRRQGQQIWSVGFSPNGQYFAASGDGGVSIWSIVDGTRPKFKAIPGPPADRLMLTSLRFSRDSNLLAWVRKSSGKEAHGGHSVHLWDLQNSQARLLHAPPLTFFHSAIAFYPDSWRLAFLSLQEEIVVWDVVRDQEAYAFGRGGIAPGSGEIALSADGALLAVGGSRMVSIWHNEAKKLLLELPNEHSMNANMVWSPSGDLLAVGSFDGGIGIWNIPRIRTQLAEIGLDW